MNKINITLSDDGIKMEAYNSNGQPEAVFTTKNKDCSTLSYNGNLITFTNKTTGISEETIKKMTDIAKSVVSDFNDKLKNELDKLGIK